MTFEDMWKSLEEKDTTGKYKQAREMADLNIEQLEYAYNSGYADAKSKYERSRGEWVYHSDGYIAFYTCSRCNGFGDINDKFCSHCGSSMKGGAE